MILFIHSNALYLLVTKDCSRASGIFFLSDNKPLHLWYKGFLPKLNGIVHVLCKKLCNVVASTVEAEYGAMFLNGQQAVPMDTTLEEMNRPQPATPIQVDNSTAVGIDTQAIKQKQSKSMDKQFYWINNCIK